MSTTTREITLNSRNGQITFTTILTNAQAMIALRSALQANLIRGDFPHSLVSQYDRKGRLSQTQWGWVHKFIIDLSTPAPAPVIEDTKLEGIVALMDRAFDNGNGLKNPKITVRIEGIEFRVSRGGDRSRYPGCVNVTDLGPFGSNVWFGRIHRDGRLQAGRDMTSAIRERLSLLNADPVGFAAGYGKLTGSCCFCNSPLKTAESTEVGYGPVCAGKWGLPWGNRVAAA